MGKTTTSTDTPLRSDLERLAAFDPTPLPVISLYLNMQADQHGRDNYDVYVRNTLPDRARGFPGGSPARESFDADVDRVTRYLSTEVRPSANGLALFACTGRDRFFEAIQLDVPIDEHWLHVGDRPHLYPLARLNDQYPRYAALAVDRHSAKLFVFALGRTERQEDLQGVKTRRTSAGGWSQARYQRHVGNFHLQHVKEVVSVLEGVVRDDRVQHIVIAGDEATVAMLREQLPQHLAEKVVDAAAGDPRDASDREVLSATLESLREQDARTDAQKADELLGEWRASGLAVVGARDTLKALEMGQVDELVIAASPDVLKEQKRGVAAASAPSPGTAPDVTVPLDRVDEQTVKLAGELVAKAHQTGSRITFLEDRSLLAEVGGVGALLRFKV